MYARTNTIRGNPQAIDDGIANIREEVMPLVQGMDGCVGLSMLADRDSGRCIVTTAWTGEEALRASADGVRAARERAARIFDGEVEVAEWEIALMHRMHESGDGARTRVIWGHTDPGNMDDLLSTFRMTMMPRLEELPGFASCNLMVDRRSGRSALAVTYAGADDMRRADERAAQLRREAGETMGLQIDEVAEFDLVVAHLRVPETV
jgi:heme-degrading monooxygenase HmoA